MKRADRNLRMDRLMRMGRMRNFPLEHFKKTLAAVGRSTDTSEVLRRLLNNWTGLPLGAREARRCWGEIERLFLDLRERLGKPLSLQTVLLHYFHTQAGRLKQPHLVSGGELELLLLRAITDPLTGLYNRRFLADNLSRHIARAARSKAFLSVVAMDLQGFKTVNDRFGHPVGDRVLARTADIIRKSLRPGDVACRWGGDEFVAVLPQADLFASFAVAERIRRNVVAAAASLRAGLTLGLYYGVASFPFDADSAESLLRVADRRLYQCREQWRFGGGNRRRYPRFSPEAIRLRLRAGRHRDAWVAPVVNVGFGGLAFRAPDEDAVPPRGEAELTQRDTERRPVRIRVINSAPLRKGGLRVGCKYA
ncbi:MAG: GGDEF domain-containing protein [Thermoanaerobaculia bacterium]